MTYQDLKTALDLFNLGDRATLRQIKARHRDLVKEHHPDKDSDCDTVMMQKINAAYEILSAYCENYRFSFTEEEFLDQFPAERLRQQFEWDPVWGGKKESDEQ